MVKKHYKEAGGAAALTAELGVAGTAAAALAAGLAGFILGDALAHEGESIAIRQSAADRAYRQARARLAAQLGVGPGGIPPQLLKPLTDAWKKRSAEIISRAPTLRPGAE